MRPPFATLLGEQDASRLGRVTETQDALPAEITAATSAASWGTDEGLPVQADGLIEPQVKLRSWHYSDASPSTGKVVGVIYCCLGVRLALQYR
ncbi:hypothetical protein AB6802_27510 [Mesorhizobium sp. RCC_202]|uniref:hypothetical protein n=1 Tax=Mesorhizobium sp. RCC_202 TaxID=3239222 RepID=UPI003524E94A